MFLVYSNISSQSLLTKGERNIAKYCALEDGFLHPQFPMYSCEIQIKMSDILENYKKQNIDWKLKVSTDSPLTYVNRQLDLRKQILFSVEIPWPLLQLWHCIRQSVTSVEETRYVNYIDLFNASVPDGWFVIKRECERIESLLYKQASYINSTVMKTKGRKKKGLDLKLYRRSVQRGELESVE